MMDYETFDNRSKILKDDIAARLRKGDRVSVAAAYFSIYGFQELKRELEACDEFRFIYTEPTYIQETSDKAQREFYIPRLNRERSLYGTEFEIRLRNELTQRSIAKECAAWVRRKARFKSFKSSQGMQPVFGVRGDGDADGEQGTCGPDVDGGAGPGPDGGAGAGPDPDATVASSALAPSGAAGAGVAL
ncbi:MAG: hypothetical protein ACI364_00040, partial [Coriobacteriales bacterium]